MVIIVVLAVVCIIALQVTGQIPPDAVGGSLMIGLVVFVGSIAMGLLEAFKMRRGIIGWLINPVVAFLGAFFAAQAGGMLVIMLLSPAMTGRSLAATGGPVMLIGLVLVTIISLGGAWAALLVLNKFRDKPDVGSAA